MEMTKPFLPCNRPRRPLRSPSHTVPVPTCPEHLSLGGDSQHPLRGAESPSRLDAVGDRALQRGRACRPSPDRPWPGSGGRARLWSPSRLARNAQAALPPSSPAASGASAPTRGPAGTPGESGHTDRFGASAFSLAASTGHPRPAGSGLTSKTPGCPTLAVSLLALLLCQHP